MSRGRGQAAAAAEPRSGRRGSRPRAGAASRSTRWLERQLNDPYVKRAKAEGYRCRAAYKLIELDERFGLLKGAQRVVDLGIAPGGWTQVVRKRLPQAAHRRHRSAADRADRGRRRSCRWISWTMRRRTRSSEALGGAARSRPVGHGGEHGRPSADRPSAHDGAGRGGARISRCETLLSPAAPSSPRCSRAAPTPRCVAQLKRHFATVKHAKPPGEPQGIVRMVCRRAGVQGSRRRQGGRSLMTGPPVHHPHGHAAWDG